MATELARPIEVSDLTKTYKLGFFLNKRVRALIGLSLRVERGQVYGLLGPNGAGKSTTIKILMNLVHADAGQARIFGVPVSQSAARREVGFVPENPTPYEYLTGREFVTLAGKLGGLTRHELDGRVKEVLGKVQMERTADLQLRRFSKGMLQRIVLAQALVHRPKLLVLDEPTSGLDPVGRRQIRDLVLAERDAGTTILFCTHIIPDVEALCDRVAVLVSGKLIKEGSVQELVSSQVPLVEVLIERLSVDKLRGLEVPLESVQEIGGRLLVKVGDEHASRLLRRTDEAGGKICSLHPARFSLEELFMQTVERSNRSAVGGEIS